MVILLIILGLLALSAAIALALIAVALRRRSVPVAMPFALMLTGQLIWTCGYFAELLTPTIGQKIVVDNIEMLGSNAVAAGALVFALVYTGNTRLLRRYTWVLTVPTLITVALMWTDSLHGLLRQMPKIDLDGPVPRLTYDLGPGLVALACCNALLILSAVLRIARHLRHSQQLFRWQSALMMLGLSTPVLGVIPVLLGLIQPADALDIMPITFVITNPLWALALFQHRLFDLIPVARDLLVEQMSDGLIVVDGQSRVIDLNPRACQLLGRRSALFGQPIAALLPAAAERLEEQPVLAGVQELRPADGSEPVIVECLSVPLKGAYQHPIGWQIILRDITAQHQVEQALRQSEKRFRDLMEQVRLLGVMIDREGRLIYCNDELLRTTRWQREQILGRLWFGTFVPDQLFAPGEFAQVLDGGDFTAYYEYDILTASGERRRIAWNNTLMRDLQGRVIGVSCLGEDITARLAAEARLREREELFRLTFDQAPIGAAMVGPDLRFTRVNEALCRITGYSAGELVGRGFPEITHPDDLDADIEQNRSLLDGLIDQYALEKRYIRKDGSEVWVHQTVRLVRDEVGQPRYSLAQIEDISARLEAETALQASQALLRGILEHAPTAIEVLDARTGRYLLVNSRTSDALGRSREEVLGRTVAELYPPDLAARWQEQDREVTHHGRVIQTEDTIGEADGVTRTYLGTKFPIYDGDNQVVAIGAIYTDISERVRAEEERRMLERKLQETQRLESLGVLAGGIAHDFNNILSGILGYADLARQDVPPDSDTYGAINQIMTHARRAAELTSQMLAYAGKGRYIMQPVQLNTLLREMIDLLGASAARHAVVELRLGEHLPPVEADTAQIRQIVINLLMNAAEAISPGGLIEVSTSCVQLSAEQLQAMTLAADAPPGNYVCLTVRDHGSGMDAETLERIFDPFFTTKFTGRGLGLAAVHGIVRSHRGALHVVSEPGRGTTFQVWLPALVSAVESAPSPMLLPLFQRGTMLVIDDEVNVRALLEQMLPRLGYRVRSAPDGPSGLALLQQRIPDLAGALVDLTMPGMGGDDVARAIRKVEPGLPITLMSGYRPEDITGLTDLEINSWLQKPFTLSSLLAALTT
jgi:PAS domain S-box-containing protein